MTDLSRTLGELKASGWESLPVKEEIRRNAVRKIAAGVAGDPASPAMVVWSGDCPSGGNAVLRHA